MKGKDAKNVNPRICVHLYQPGSAACATSEQDKEQAQRESKEQGMLRVGDGPLVNLGRASERSFRAVLRIGLHATQRRGDYTQVD